MDMTNIEKYNNIFMDVFQVEESRLDASFTKDNVEGWDSVKQLSLTSTIEDEFDLLLDPEDIIGFTSYEAGKTILGKNGVEL